MKRWFLMSLLFAFLCFAMTGCFGGEKPGGEDSGEILWERGQLISGEKTMQRILEGEAGTFPVTYRGIFGEGEETLVLSCENGAYSCGPEGERADAYEHAACVTSPDGSKKFYVLTDAEDLDFRSFWREIWLRPQDREIQMQPLFWTGEVYLVCEEGFEFIPKAQQRQARILLGIDALPIAWAEEAKGFREDRDLSFLPEKGTVVVKNQQYVAGEEEWNAFVEKCSEKTPARITIVTQGSDASFQNVFATSHEFISQLFFDGTYYDYHDHQGSHADENYRYLKMDALERAPENFVWCLSREDYEHPSSHYSKGEMDALFPDRPRTEFEDPVEKLFYVTEKPPKSSAKGEIIWFKDDADLWDFYRRTFAFFREDANVGDQLDIIYQGYLASDGENTGGTNITESLEKTETGYVFRCGEIQESYEDLVYLQTKYNGKNLDVALLTDRTEGPEKTSEQWLQEMFLPPDQRSQPMRVVFWEYINEGGDWFMEKIDMEGRLADVQEEYRLEAEILWGIRTEALNW